MKDTHTTVINNDLEGFKEKFEGPISPIVLCGKDSNGLNVLHKVYKFSRESCSINLF